MTREVQKIADRICNERNPEERAHLKREMDQMPLSSGELEQVHQREVNRKAKDIKEFREQRNQ